MYMCSFIVTTSLASTMYVNQRAYFLSFPFPCSHQLFFFLGGGGGGLFVGVGCCFLGGGED